MQKLINYDFCYADEFDVQGYWILTEDQYKKFNETVTDFFNEGHKVEEYYFGTNEWIDINEISEILHPNYISDIPDHEAEIIKSRIGDQSGMVNWEYLEERMVDKLRHTGFYDKTEA